MSIDRQIEAVLFYKAAPVKKSVLAKLLEIDEETLNEALDFLKERLKAGATALVLTDTEAELSVSFEFDELIDSIRKEDLKRDIGKAGAETLAIVLYRGPVSRSEIDRIRGVNSSYILRSLEVRGLVERDTRGNRGSEFRPTTELLRYLGIREKTEMPDYANVMNALEKFENQPQEN